MTCAMHWDSWDIHKDWSCSSVWTSGRSDDDDDDKDDNENDNDGLTSLT